MKRIKAQGDLYVVMADNTRENWTLLNNDPLFSRGFCVDETTQHIFVEFPKLEEAETFLRMCNECIPTARSTAR